MRGADGLPESPAHLPSGKGHGLFQALGAVVKAGQDVTVAIEGRKIFHQAAYYLSFTAVPEAVTISMPLLAPRTS